MAELSDRLMIQQEAILPQHSPHQDTYASPGFGPGQADVFSSSWRWWSK
jgi:hypothetical protein